MHSTSKLSKPNRFDDVGDINFLGESFSGVYKLLVLRVSLATAATTSAPELQTSAEREILSGLDGCDNLLLLIASKCGVSVILYLVKLARHNNVF